MLESSKGSLDSASKKKSYLITSALPYINGVKHLGNMIGSMLPGDLYARFLRQSGRRVLYICGTDEHGTPAEIAAQEAGLSVEDYCEHMHQVQKKIYEQFNVSFDFFGRTSAESNRNFSTEMFKRLYENGYILEQDINQYYSIDDHRFLPDRYIEGTCPHCGYERARGDQCDGCGVLLNPEELVNPYSAISKSRNVELRKTRHFFLDVPKLEPLVSAWIQKQDLWSDIVKGIAKKWIKDGLQPRCITRDLKWGIPVPLEWVEQQKQKQTQVQQVQQGSGADFQADDQNEKVFYVWYDAPNGYVGMTMDWARYNGDRDAWKSWWKPTSPDDVFYVEFMAKDNIPFHSVFWPAELLGSHMGIKMVDDIKGFHWLTYEHGKFSTSMKRGVFTDVALDLFPADYWRYYLFANCPETSDADFSFENFALVINKDLVGILGNFEMRTLSLLKKASQGQVAVSLTPSTIDQDLSQKVQDKLNALADNLYNRKVRSATSNLRALWVLGNEYITQKEPWHLLKTDPDQAEIVLVHCIHLLRIFAIASFPFIPETALKIGSLLGLTEVEISRTPLKDCLDFQGFKAGHKVGEACCLFDKIEPDRVKELTERFSGQAA